MFSFITGHLIVQQQLDDENHRDISTWIALISADLGQACATAVDWYDDPDAARATVAWLACTSADALRARLSFPRTDQAEHIEQLHAHLVSVQMCEPAWLPTIQVSFVTGVLGELAQAATPLMTEDPAGHGPVPRFNQAVARALLRLHPELRRESTEVPDDEEQLDPVEATCWALQDVAHAAGGAAVLLHRGGLVGMPVKKRH